MPLMLSVSAGPYTARISDGGVYLMSNCGIVYPGNVTGRACLGVASLGDLTAMASSRLPVGATWDHVGSNVASPVGDKLEMR